METETRSWVKRKWTEFEGFVEGVIYDRDLSVSARLFGLFLHPFSYLFSTIVRLRLFLYMHRFVFKDKPLDCLVLVVGNLTVGGTGKTPVVERFTKELMAKGKKDFDKRHTEKERDADREVQRAMRSKGKDD